MSAENLILNVVLNKNYVNCFRILLHVMQIIYDDIRSKMCNLNAAANVHRRVWDKRTGTTLVQLMVYFNIIF